MQAVSDITRKAVWEEMFELKRHNRYYRSIQTKTVCCNRTIHIFAGLIGAIAIATNLITFSDENSLLGFDPKNEFVPEIQLITILLFAAVYFVDKIFKFSTKVSVLSQVINGCSTLDGELEDLWRRINRYAVSDDQAFIEHRSLVLRKDTILKIADNALVTDKKSLRDDSSRQARKDLEYRSGSMT